MDFAASSSRILCDNTAYDLLILYMDEHNLIMPTNAYKDLIYLIYYETHFDMIWIYIANYFTKVNWQSLICLKGCIYIWVNWAMTSPRKKTHVSRYDFECLLAFGYLYKHLPAFLFNVLPRLLLTILISQSNNTQS